MCKNKRRKGVRTVEVVSWIFGIYILIAAPFVLVYNVVDMYYLWKCRKKRGILSPSCTDGTCKWRKHCDQYEQPLTHEDIEELRRRVDELKKRT